MSQFYLNSTSGGGGGGIIQTIAGDTGSITGANVTIYANRAGVNSGSTVGFDNSGTISTLNVSDSDQNTIIGFGSGNAFGNLYASNTFLGFSSGISLGLGADQNIGVGNFVLSALAGGASAVGNIGIGYSALTQLVSGNDNIAIGRSTGSSYNGSEAYNILIGSINGTPGEQGVIKIGTSGTQTSCFIQGIANVTVANSQIVTVDINGQLGSTANNLSNFIQTINGDSGSITGSTVSILANVAALGSGSSVSFINSGTTSTLKVSDASNNTLIGAGAGKAAISGVNNSGVGANALSGLTSGTSNMAFGTSAAATISSGNNNIAIGTVALQNVSTTDSNVAIGSAALQNLTTGSANIAIGTVAGQSLTTNDSNNILIGTVGTAGNNGLIAIGTNGTHTACRIQGINGVTVTGTAVLCSTTGVLGTVVSSERYKENIIDMPKDVSIMNLRPVKFNYRKEFSPDHHQEVNYGLIAEEVDKEFPYLCFYKDKKPESIKYHELCVFLLAEVQRLSERVKKLEL